MNGTSLNEALVFNGLAWWYYQFAPNEKRLEDLQKVAQVERRNLWSEKKSNSSLGFSERESKRRFYYNEYIFSTSANNR